MSKELEQLAITDTVVDFASLCQQHGARNILYVLRQCDRQMFEEIKAQIGRLDLPALFVPPNASSM
jgi:hypothetical protein